MVFIAGYRTGKINIWNDLATLEERGKYLQYVKTLESLLCSGSWNNTEEETYKNTSYHLWRQLVLTCNSFGSRLINQQKYPKALGKLGGIEDMSSIVHCPPPPLFLSSRVQLSPVSIHNILEILEKAQGLISYDKMVDPDTANELKAFVKDAYGHYYAKRNKPNAALQYVTAAVNMHRRRNDPLNVSKCRLHSAYVLFQLGRYDESARTMKDILDMVENGSLQSQGNSDDYQLVLLVAVTYHNIAVHQLTVGRIGDACISSQNARRLARLCLSVSSRYIHNFEATHKRALSELTSVMEKEQNKDQVVTFKKLINELFQ
uniref:Anaphase-promoting complex subunit 5 n=1 Tax=Ditylum brightwellii TaxID=49249 RepID=A0A6V2AXG6_9STRA